MIHGNRYCAFNNTRHIPIILFKNNGGENKEEKEGGVAKVPVKKLMPGMKLARAVVNKNGTVMLGENTELTDVLIEKMEDMDITGVYIQGPSTTLPPKEQMLADLDERFRNVEAMPHMDVLKKLLVEHLGGLYEEHECTSPER